MKRAFVWAACVAVGLVPFVGTATASHPPHHVVVNMSDFKFALSKKAIPRGTAVFRVANNGQVVHDFKIAGKKTPIYSTGKGGVLRIQFKKGGRYKYICTVAGHEAAGMWGVLRVR